MYSNLELVGSVDLLSDSHENESISHLTVSPHIHERHSFEQLADKLLDVPKWRAIRHDRSWPPGHATD